MISINVIFICIIGSVKITVETPIIVLSNCIKRLYESIISGLIFQNFSCFSNCASMSMIPWAVSVREPSGGRDRSQYVRTLRNWEISRIYVLSKYSYSKLHPCFLSKTSLDSRFAKFVIFSSLVPLLSIFRIISNPPSILKL